MNIKIREYRSADCDAACEIWNRVVEDGVAFPQEECLDAQTGEAFFEEQTYTAVAEDTDSGQVVGLYILHPNNIGRCGHDAAGRAIMEQLQEMGEEAYLFDAIVMPHLFPAETITYMKRKGMKLPNIGHDRPIYLVGGGSGDPAEVSRGGSVSDVIRCTA